MQEQYIESDRYYLKEGYFKKLKDEFGMEAVPTDFNAALVVEKQGTGLEKLNEETKEDLQYNIRCRFGLKAKEDYYESDY